MISWWGFFPHKKNSSTVSNKRVLFKQSWLNSIESWFLMHNIRSIAIYRCSNCEIATNVTNYKKKKTHIIISIIRCKFIYWTVFVKLISTGRTKTHLLITNWEEKSFDQQKSWSNTEPRFNSLPKFRIKKLKHHTIWLSQVCKFFTVSIVVVIHWRIPFHCTW